MDEVMLYNRALNESEISTSYDYVANGLEAIPEPVSFSLVGSSLIALIIRRKMR